MQKVLTAEQMREVDGLTTEKYGIPSLLLMENAAHAAARAIAVKLGGSVRGKRFDILCGKGNNGGDGAALARILWTLGASCFVYLLGSVSDTKGDARINLETIKKMSHSDEMNGLNDNCLFLYELRPDEIRNYISHWFDSSTHMDCFIDALFGTGLSGPAEGIYAEIINALSSDIKHRLDAKTVVSLDMPSGLASDSADPAGATVDADLTITFTAPKLGNVYPPASRSNGELVIANIGSPDGLVDEQPSQIYLAEKRDAAVWLRMTEFSTDSYKNRRGHALMIAGSKNYTGAAVLCGNAAMRSGVGLVTLAVPEGSRESVVARVSPEVMVRGISETAEGSAAIRAIAEIGELLENVDVVAIGSGLSSKEQETRDFVRQIVEARKTPVVIDADGLTALSPFEINGSTELPLILTPHEGEFMRLLGTTDKDVIKDRIAAVRDFAVKHNVILVLKGERALIGEPEGKVVVNPTGNSGLGKAGNGDTLTGIITGFAAQAVQMKINIFETVVAAVYIAGMAGDFTEKKFGKRVMTASDVRECLVDVLEDLAKK